MNFPILLNFLSFIFYIISDEGNIELEEWEGIVKKWMLPVYLIETIS